MGYCEIPHAVGPKTPRNKPWKTERQAAFTPAPIYAHARSGAHLSRYKITTKFEVGELQTQTRESRGKIKKKSRPPFHFRRVDVPDAPIFVCIENERSTKIMEPPLFLFSSPNALPDVHSKYLRPLDFWAGLRPLKRNPLFPPFLSQERGEAPSVLPSPRCLHVAFSAYVFSPFYLCLWGDGGGVFGFAPSRPRQANLHAQAYLVRLCRCPPVSPRKQL